MDNQEKEVRWVGRSRNDIQNFPDDARKRAGYELQKVQLGKRPKDFKPMKSVGSGVREIRIRDGDSNHYRVMYIAKYEEAVYVLHAFHKTTRATEDKDIKLARKRLKAVKRYRQK